MDLAPHAELAAIAGDLRPRIARMQADMLYIAQGLLRARRLLPHGAFEDWVERELGIERRTAERMLSVARRFEGKCDMVSHLPTSVLYELAAPSTPDEVVEKVLSGQLEPAVSVIREAKGKASIPNADPDHTARRALRVLSQLWSLDDGIDCLAAAVLNTDDPEYVAEGLVTITTLVSRIVSDVMRGR